MHKIYQSMCNESIKYTSIKWLELEFSTNLLRCIYLPPTIDLFAQLKARASLLYFPIWGRKKACMIRKLLLPLSARQAAKSLSKRIPSVTMHSPSASSSPRQDVPPGDQLESVTLDGPPSKNVSLWSFNAYKLCYSFNMCMVSVGKKKMTHWKTSA